MNPFQPSQPVNPKYFANRKNVVEAFRLALKNASETRTAAPTNIAVLGTMVIWRKKKEKKKTEK